VPVDLAGEVPLERASDLAEGASLGGALVNIGAGVGVHSHAGHDGHVECPVEPAVAATVDAVADGVAGGGGDRVDAREARECCLGADAPRVGPCGVCDSGCDRSDARLVEQACGGAGGEQGSHLPGEVAQLLVGCADTLGQADGLGTCDTDGEFLGAGAPGCDGGDVTGGEGAAGVNAEVNNPQECDEGVDRRGALVGDVVA